MNSSVNDPTLHSGSDLGGTTDIVSGYVDRSLARSSKVTLLASTKVLATPATGEHAHTLLLVFFQIQISVVLFFFYYI